ncbi:type I restriction enzyme S subunit [Idiomarina aquatica]|uniref:Type I restriction enzyme S subunit n=1 Tax=Idiomarina aquatica TaxID=1327752 RepID=A0A4V3CME5_9GAMM|nr:restriction endonuclease subunit S [Idiomarina aquatica]TDP28443.1 type I restriction enzyme S subunit [Idiomarina aquatica]
MVSYPKYLEHQATKYPWIGDLPKSWCVRRLKEVGRLFGGAGFPHEYQNMQDEELYFYKVGDLRLSENGRTLLASPHTVSKDTAQVLRATIVPKGAIVYAKIGAALLLNRRRMTTASCCIDNNMTAYVVDAEKVIPEWAFYWLSTIDFGEHVNPGAVPSLSEAYQSILPLPVPPLEEQIAIARFLDHKTAQIDALIAKKQSLLDKLAEQRGSLISQAVTKGLNDAVPMKKSDVAWLGEIPRHWETKRLRFLMTMSGGLTPRTSEPRYWGGDIPWVSPKDMKSERLSSSIDTLTEDALNETTLRLYPPGKVLIVVRGMILAHTFPVAVNEVPVTVNQDMKVLETTMNPEYLAVLLRGIQSLVLSIVEESAHGTKVLRTDLLKNMVLPVPPRVEQDEIVSEVGRISSRIDKMVSTVTAAITKLQEYRSALITNAVTGKIDVRDFCIPATTEQKEVAHG